MAPRSAGNYAPGGTTDGAAFGEEKKRPPEVAVVVLGWLGAKPKHLRRYVELYNARGIHAVTFVASVMDVLWVDLGKGLEERISRLAQELAAWLSGERGREYSDSLCQVYRGLDVGSAKPSIRERQPAKLYKLKHLTKVEVVTNDTSGCTFMLGFDNLRSQSVAPPQWTMRNVGDRNRFLHGILNVCKDVIGRLPKVVGIDFVEMALWAKLCHGHW